MKLICIQVGSPTILVNNAGVVKGKLLLDLEEDDIKE
jgi:all-trans-retinol dehydrogenase (NAD+)